MVKYLIDIEALLTVQKLFDLFGCRKVGKRKEFIKKIDICFASLQKNRKAKRLAFNLYNKIFTAWTPEMLQKICMESNRLVCMLVRKYGDFTKDPVWDEIDGLDKLMINEISKDCIRHIN